MKRALLFKSTHNYWPQARLAVESAKLHNPTYDIHVATDGLYQTGYTDHDITGYANARGPRLAICQPALMIDLLNSGYDEVYFVDSDTYTYGPYTEAEELLARSAILVTPHVHAPLPLDGRAPSLLQIAKMGNYNAGFIAANKLALQFLEFYLQYTTAYPVLDSENYVAAEQSWLRFACDFDPRARVFRHPGYNLAYWNVAQRQPVETGGVWTVGSRLPLRLTHFSGLLIDQDPSSLSKYQNRYTVGPETPPYKLYSDYQELWKASVARG
jgi:hypothetical protein